MKRNNHSTDSKKLPVTEILRSLRIQYNVFILLLILYTASDLSGIVVFPRFSSETSIQLESFAILFTLAAIPGSLRWFGIRMKKIRKLNAGAYQISAYKRNALIRLGLLFGVGILDLTGYFMTENYIFLLMAAMVVVASIFCIPTAKRVVYDLTEPTEAEEEEE